MCNVENFHHAINKRETDGGGEKPRRVDNAVNANGDKLVHTSDLDKISDGKANDTAINKLLISFALATMLYFLKPFLIQSALLIPSGGLTVSAG